MVYHGGARHPTYLRNDCARRVGAVDACRAIRIEDIECQVLIESFKLGVVFENGRVAGGNHGVEGE